MAAETILDRFYERVRSHPDRVALRHRQGGEWRAITWADYGRAVTLVGKALLAQGFEAGDKLSILSDNRPEWFFADIGCMSIGATTVPIYVTNSPDQVAYIVEHSESKIAVVDNAEQLEKILQARSKAPRLEKVVVIEGLEAGTGSDFVTSWDDFLAFGGDIDDRRLEDARRSVTAEDLATFVYTSGTTGSPKAVMLSHENIWWTACQSVKRIPVVDADRARALSYLPLSHIAERMISHMLHIYYGSETWFAQSVESLVEDLQACRPTYFFGVPRVWEKFHAGMQERMAAANPDDRKTKLAKKAIAVGRRVVEAEQQATASGKELAGVKLPLGLKLQHRLLDKLVLGKIRYAIGLDQCRLTLSAAAPINSELLVFFHAIGLKIAEGYGQSEDTGPTAWNPPGAIRIGTVGPAFPGMELKIAGDGEILARGGNVTSGYYKDEKATGQLIDSEGWMHSGDIGRLDEHGYLTITDRKKDLIITAGGKNIAPQEIENRIKLHELISQVVVIGDRRPFLTALITLDEDKAPSWAEERSIDGDMAVIAGHERTLEEIESWIHDVNESMARVEGVKKFRVLERDFREEEDEITPTLKVKRKRIGESYAPEIEEMYSKGSPDAAAAGASPRQ